MLQLVQREPALIAWALQILLIPLYVFRSGLPQPGDMFIVVLLPVAMFRWDGKLDRKAREVVRPLLWFTAWACAVNYAWALVTANFAPSGPDSYLLYPIYYVYNVLVFLVAFILYRRHGDAFIRLTVYVIVATVYFQVAASFVMRSTFSRGTLFFNNPNQLGYYALLAATLIALVHHRLKFRLTYSGFALTCCGYLALTSASRAATAGVALLFIFLVFSNPRVIIAACLITAIVLAIGGPITERLSASQERVLHPNDHHLSFAEERGYDRIWHYPEYLLLGAGEGGLSRFDTATHLMTEIHSSAGTIVFSYGLVGTTLFLTFGLRVIRGARKREILMLLPPLLYTIAHQGLRFTLLWVLIAIFVSIKQTAPPRAARPLPIGL